MYILVCILNIYSNLQLLQDQSSSMHINNKNTYA
jgi:hypothetical protein